MLQGDSLPDPYTQPQPALTPEARRGQEPEFFFSGLRVSSVSGQAEQERVECPTPRICHGFSLCRHVEKTRPSIFPGKRDVQHTCAKVGISCRKSQELSSAVRAPYRPQNCRSWSNWRP